MTWDEWWELVDRLNVRFPHQQIDEFTAQGWYDDQLHKFTREQVGRALARCVGTVEFISCYALVQAIEMENREWQATRSTAIPLPPRRRNVPPEWKEIRKLLERSSLPSYHPDYVAGPLRPRIEELAGYLDARLAEQSTAPRRERPA